jgi:hypothetical protein
VFGLGPGEDVAAAAMAVSGFVTFFDACLRDNDALNIGDRMGTLSYEAVSDLMACAQTRSRGRSSLKCKSDAR